MDLSIIIPLAPGEDYPARLVRTLSGHPADAELLLVTAGGQLNEIDTDTDTDAGLRLITSAPGRGRQQNKAASLAQGQWLWFVHADSDLSAGAVEHILEFLQQSSPCLGYCDLQFAGDGPPLTRLNAFGANLRSRLFRLPYGDQGFCMPKDWFVRLDGFREDLPRGEDLDLVVRARDAGLPIRAMGLTITTSARRYREHGWLKTTVQHQFAARKLIRQARRQEPDQ